MLSSSAKGFYIYISLSIQIWEFLLVKIRGKECIDYLDRLSLLLNCSILLSLSTVTLVPFSNGPTFFFVQHLINTALGSLLIAFDTPCKSQNQLNFSLSDAIPKCLGKHC